jgi:poly(3-hydroxybutyrate) depolymerase
MAHNRLSSAAGGRYFMIVEPETKPWPAPLPLVLVIHGDTGSAESMREFTEYEKATLGEARVIYLQAEKHYWGLREDRYPTERAYMKEVVDEFAGTNGRVAIFGWSSGAYLAQRYACDDARVFALTLSGGKSTVNCTSRRTIPVLALHGTNDKAHTLQQGEAMVLSLREAHRCGASEQPTLLPPCVEYDGCPVSFCRIEGGTHHPWNKAARVSWAFFQQHRLSR